MPQPPLDPELIEICLDDTKTHVALRGDLGIEGTQAVELRFTSVVAGRHRPAIVDLSDVPFISSYAIGMLVAAARSLQNRGHPMVLVGASGRVAEVLAASRVHLVMPIAADEREALEMLTGGA